MSTIILHIAHCFLINTMSLRAIPITVSPGKIASVSRVIGKELLIEDKETAEGKEFQEIQ